MEFTGERYLPEIAGNIFLEHTHRYRFALQYCKGKEVLDIASGEGFGSDLLATVASRVTGIDLSDVAVDHALRKYRRSNLEFQVGSVTEIPLADSTVDVVVSFETIEHIDAHEMMLDEIRRVLRPGGVLIISTPDKATYTDATGNINPFHVRELYREEFSSLLSSRFGHVTTHGQRIGFGSLIACETAPAPMREYNASTRESAEGLVDALYLIAVASDDPDAVPGLHSLFSQDIMASEPVLVRVDAELAAERERSADQILELDPKSKAIAEEHQDLLQMIGPELEIWQREILTLQTANLQASASTGRLIRGSVLSSLLYKLARISFFSDRRRRRFLKSAKKRDPLVLSKALEDFSNKFFAGVSRHLVSDLSEQIILTNLSLKVTAIVPNYNHAPFLRKRLDSILAQTYPLVDIIILDDASTDESCSIISEYASRYPERIRVFFNSDNSGNVFDQWHKGYEMATGELVWFCESDDYCEPDFLAKLLPAFLDQSVMLAFGKVQYVDGNEAKLPGLDAYRETAEAEIWDERVKRPAKEWFFGAFGVKNVIPNVGGSVWRRGHLRDDDWELARRFRIMGDWFLYCVVAGGGQIAYEPRAVSYFRIHGDNTSAGDAQKQAAYYQEYVWLMTALKVRWPIPDHTVDRFIEASREVFQAAKPQGLEFDQLVSRDMLLKAGPARPHILIGFLGFAYGGGEIFPIHLANALHRLGVKVSMLQMTRSMDHPDVHGLLDPGIPVYSAEEIRRMGIGAFVQKAGISLVHSHIASVEMIMLDEGKVTLPYIVTLHGSYEAMDIPDAKVARWAGQIDRLVYTANRNMKSFRRAGVREETVRKFRNAMPVDDLPFPESRMELGIPESAVVYAFVARGETGKGWPQSVRAFQELTRRHPDREMALLMIGSGPETDAAREVADKHPRIQFLGFQQRIHGLYKISDVALAPTRFKGESFPLCLIQAMQVGTPVIATDIGEIRSMIQPEEGSAGFILPNVEDDDTFVAEIVAAMELMLDRDRRAKLSEAARVLGATYSMDALAEEYLELYGEILAQQ